MSFSRRRVAIAAVVGFATFAARADEPQGPRTFAVVVDRSASLQYADPDGDARAALAVAVALAARPTDRIAVSAPFVDPPVAAEAVDLETLRPVLVTIAAEPLRAGGVDLEPAFKAALAQAGTRGLVLAYTADLVDVVDAQGKVPPALLEKARAKMPRPDRAAVNETARAALLESTAAIGTRLLALRVPLPPEARGLGFLQGATVLDASLSPDSRPLAGETAKSIATLLGAQELEQGELDGRGAIAAREGQRVAIFGARLKVPGGVFVSDRCVLVDAKGPIEVVGEGKIAFLTARRPSLGVVASAHRLATKAIHVHAELSDAVSPVEVAAEGVKLVRGGPGQPFAGKVPASPKKSVQLAVARNGVSVGALEVAVERAFVRATLAGEPVAGARLSLEGTVSLPSELMPPSIGLKLRCKDLETSASLVREGTHYKGPVAFPAAGTWILGASDAGGLEVDLDAVTVKPAPVLTARVADGPVILVDGSGTIEAAVELSPPDEATVSFVLGARDLKPAKPVLLRSKELVSLPVSGIEPGPHELVVRAEFSRGGEATARVPVELRAAPGLKRFIALGLIVVALGWFAVHTLRKKAIAKRFGDRQLRGIGANGKISFERYLLRDHRDGGRAAVLPPGPLAIRIDLSDGKAIARPPEETQLIPLVTRRPVQELVLVHETPIALIHGLYNRRLVYLEREPTGDELLKRYDPGSQSVAPSEEGTESDVYVLLDEKENISARLVPVESARLPKVDSVVGPIDSDEQVVIANSEEGRVLDDDEATLDPDADNPDEPTDRNPDDEPVVLDPGSSDDSVDEDSDAPKKK